MDKFINEPARQTPVAAEYDVVVIGGGVAGVAAAVAASRNKAKTLLVENHCVLGGLATEGLVAIYLPICDGCGRQVMGGLTQEMLHLSARNAPAEIPQCWTDEAASAADDGGKDELLRQRRKQRYLSCFAPHAYMIALEEFVLEAGVELLYDTRLCDAVVKGERIEAVIVENKSGRQAIRAGAFVDASGDADLCVRAGQATRSHRNNARAAWFYADEGRGLQLIQHHINFERPGAGEPTFGGDSAEQITGMLTGSRPMIMERVRQLRQERGNDNLYPAIISTIPQFRVTRCLQGSFELDESHVHQWFDDAVTLAGDWRRSGPVFAVPYRTLLADSRSNLLVAGRCSSSTRAGAEVTRAIPVCASTGEAAGTAAAMAATSGTAGGADLRRLDIAALQARLRRQGIPLDRQLIEPAK